ncbi:MAG: branched-chain amino acid ABC transporter permease [Proteobacteria bacterium]|nr:branched-chain amino acid ABC transporter permease [Pseudomonadota bacterium]
MEIFLQQIINGLVQGSVYALVALGYTMVYGILGLINFAHGEVVMVGAMLALSALTAMTGWGLSPLLALPLSLLLAMAGCMLLGYSIERIAYRPLRHAPRLAPLITAIGVSIVLQNLAMMIWGREYHAFPQLIANQPHHIAGAIINDMQIIIIIMALAIMAGLMVVVHRTRLGRAMRAVAENQHAAQLMGVDVNRVISITFMLGSALAAVAGLMVSANYGLAHYYMGFLLGLKAFTAAVLGGIGNLRGAMLGGLLLGLIESLGAGYIGDLTGGFMGSQYQDVFAFFVLIAVLVFRPSGLLGERLAERA